MRKKNIRILAFVTIAVVAVAVFAAYRMGGTPSTEHGRLLPALEKRINDVRVVRIEGGDAPLTLRRDGERWVVADKSGYPADEVKLRQLLLELRGAQRVERKTSTESGFAQLGVQDPDAEGSDSRAVVLLGEGDEEIARLVVGKRRFGKGAGQVPSSPDEETYVRVAGEPNAWLATGKLTLETAPARWMDQALLDVGRARIAAAEFERADGTLTLVRPTKEAFELEPLAIPEGRTKKTPLGTGIVLNALAGLRFEDVAKADELEWPAEPEVTSTFWTYDGLRVTVESIERDAKVWAKFHADVVPAEERPKLPSAESAAEGAEGAAADATGDAAATDVDATSPPEDVAAAGDETEPKEPPGPTQEELEAEAKKINDKVGGWVFSIQAWKANALRLPADSVLEPLPAEPPPEAGDAPVTPPVDDTSSGGGDAGGGSPATPPSGGATEQPPVDPPVDPPGDGDGATPSGDGSGATPSGTGATDAPGGNGAGAPSAPSGDGGGGR